MKVLVTGRGGQVAQALLASAPADFSIVALARSDLDIADREAVMEAAAQHRPDIIINAAAYTAVDRAETEPELAQQINGAAVSYLADAARAVSARLVHLSTDFVFDGASSRPYRSDDATAPLSVYGHSKLTGEQAALTLPDALVIRTAWVYAAQGANFVRTMLRLMAEQSSLQVVCDQIGTPTHAKSLASAIWGLVKCQAHGIYHVTDAGIASWYDFAVAIEEEALASGLLQRPTQILPIGSSEYPQAARRPAFSVLDKTATWHLLGTPAAHWRQELRRMLSDLEDQNLG